MMLSDQSTRLLAIQPNESFIVQAPAGSGKTELLTQRILSLLAHHAKVPESILAITFTRKAAHEMRCRVLKALEAGKNASPPESPHQHQTWELARKVLQQDKTLGWNLLDNPQRLQIMTIDALCASLVRQMPVVSGLGGVSAISQHPGDLCRKAAISTLKQSLQTEDSSLQSLLLHLDNRQEMAVDLLASMLAKREQWLPILIGCTQIEALREQLEHHLSQIIEGFLQSLVESIQPADWFSLVPLLDFALAHVETGVLPEALSLVSQWSWPLPQDVSSLPAWRALYNWLFTSTGTLRKSVDKRQGFPPASEAPTREEKASFVESKNRMKEWLTLFSESKEGEEAWKDIPYLPDPQYSDSQWSLLNALLQILPQACAHLALHQQMQGEMDFSGMAQAASRALGHEDDPTALTLKLDYQLHHILVDEFQDTSLLQFELLEKLVAGWIPGDGRTLFLVGDPMQSIYRFRQAEVGLFLRAQEEGLGGVRLQSLFLQANFRSDPLIIDWINRYAPACFAAHDNMHMGAIAYSPSEAVRPPARNSAVRLHASGNILPCLQALLADPSLSSIAILVRARSHLVDISASLQAAKLDYQAVELESLSAQPLVQDLMSLTRAYLHLADSIAWLAVLRAPFCGFSLQDITLIRERGNRDCVWDNLNAVEVETLSPEGQKIWHRVQPVIANCLNNRLNSRLSHQIEMFWLALGGPACLARESDFRLVDSFFRLLSQHERGGSLPDMGLLASQLDQAFVKSFGGSSRIQIMTLHKAKGLEFDAVILPELQRGARAEDQPLLLWDQLPTLDSEALLVAPIHPKGGQSDPIYTFLKHMREKKEAYQLGRLLYVGMTRAKCQLHLFAQLSQKEDGEVKPPPHRSLLSLLWPQLAEDWMAVMEPSEGQENNFSSKPLAERLSPTWQFPEEVKLPIPLVSLPSLIDNQVPVHEYSYEAHQQRQLGVLLHRILHNFAILGVSPWKKSALTLQLYELGVVRGAERIVDELDLALHRVLADPRGQWILAPHASHEAEAMYGSYVIDRTFIDEQGTRWIIDYKSSSEFDPSSLEPYRTQLRHYAQIFASRGEKNIRCALYYPISSQWIELETL